MLTQSTGRYFYKKPESTRLEIGKISGEDTSWTVYLGAQPAGCSGDLATSVLVLPVISSAPVQRWAERGAVVQSDSADACVVTYTDAADGYEYGYSIDTLRWLITGIRKTKYSNDYFNAHYLYDYQDEQAPILTKIALRGDTTLALGGYRFFNIGLNESVDDSLFAVSIRYIARGPAQAAGPVFNSHSARFFDLLGRAENGYRSRTHGASFMIEHSPGRTRTYTIIRDVGVKR